MEQLTDSLNNIGILEQELLSADKTRSDSARQELKFISSSHESDTIRYAALRTIQPETRMKFYHSFRLWLHEEATEDIAALGICSMFAGFIGLVGYYASRISQ